jgi:hypothetical protein
MRVGAMHFTSTITVFLHAQRIVVAASRAAREPPRRRVVRARVHADKSSSD